MEAKKEKAVAPGSYYGKKTYHISSLFVRKKAANEKTPDYRDEGSEAKPQLHSKQVDAIMTTAQKSL